MKTNNPREAMAQALAQCAKLGGGGMVRVQLSGRGNLERIANGIEHGKVLAVLDALPPLQRALAEVVYGPDIPLGKFFVVHEAVFDAHVKPEKLKNYRMMRRLMELSAEAIKDVRHSQIRGEHLHSYKDLADILGVRKQSFEETYKGLFRAMIAWLVALDADVVAPVAALLVEEREKARGFSSSRKIAA